MHPSPTDSSALQPAEPSQEPFLDALTALASGWRLLLAAPVATAALAIGVSFLIAPLYTARVVFVPPQQQQSSAATALASLGALSGLAGNVAGLKSPADQYVSLMLSANVQDRIVDHFKLTEVYDVSQRFEARKKLEQRLRIALGKKDGLIIVEVDDTEPQRAAEIANQHVAELRRLSSELALTEAQQRRAFFEGELKRAAEQLAIAQRRLQNSGFNAGAIKAEPRAAAESYAKLKADATNLEVRLRALRTTLTDSSPEIQQQLAQLAAINTELSRLERTTSTADGADYLSQFRDFKYQETLFELLSKQFELARLDEAREGALIQVVDAATAPERKSSPKRSLFAVFGALAGFLLTAAYLLSQPLRTSIRHRLRESALR